MLLVMGSCKPLIPVNTGLASHLVLQENYILCMSEGTEHKPREKASGFCSGYFAKTNH